MPKMIKTLRGRFLSQQPKNVLIFGFVLTFMAIGSVMLIRSLVSTASVGIEAEDGQLGGCSQTIRDTAASQGQAVKFANCLQSGGGPTTYGAVLPISYNLGSLTGTVRYVATNGADTNTGTVSSPFATLAKAVSASASGDTIVIRGGTYRQGNVVIPSNKTLKILAYPSEVPTFNGAQTAASWTDENNLKYIAYTPQPVTNGSGINFINNQNLTASGVGKYPDQAWVGTQQLQQVSTKTAVVDGTFWVDTTNNRMYLTAGDVNKGGVEVSQKDDFLDILGPSTSVEGIVVTRFSNTASGGGVIKIRATADNTILKNVEIYDSAFISVMLLGGSDLMNGATLKNVTVENSNWMGVSALYTDNFTMDAVKISNTNQFQEFTNSPQSGALKTSRTRYTKVINSLISGNFNQGLWFDQSNVDVDIANNQILDNQGAGVFFEISDDLLLANNFIRAASGGQAVKMAGSSGLKLVNNTIIGGGDPVGIYTDVRSKPGCADPLQPVCTGSFGSDRDTVRPRVATLDWMPRLDLMINNIVAYPARTQFCVLTTMCIGSNNGTTYVPISSIIHQADATRGIPQTYMDGNVYANGTGKIIQTELGTYATTSAFSTAMAGSPVLIPGLEANGLYGNSWVNSDGSPSSTLSSRHDQAIAVPTNANINQYIPAGTKHYGVTYK